MPVAAKPEQLTVEALSKQNYLRPLQRQELEKSTTDIEDALKNPDRLGQADPALLRKQLQRERQMLKNGSPPDDDGPTLNKLRALEEHLRNDITNGMPSYTQMERGRPTDIDHHVSWEKANKNKVLAWKNILIRLDRNNTEPNFLSIARLRGDTVRGNPKMFQQNFDPIRWGKTIEENLIRDMSEEEYHAFLELKIVNWAKPNIMKKMSWTDAQYEAAMERLRRAMEAEEATASESEQEDRDYLEAEVREETEAVGHRQFGAELASLGIRPADFAVQLDMAYNTYRYYERTGWSKVKQAEAEALLSRLSKAVPAATEPASEGEPVAVESGEPGAE